MSELTKSGTIYKVLPIESGEGKNGTWQKQTIVIEVESGKYTKKLAIEVWNNLTKLNFLVGSKATFYIDVESGEYNGKWYTSVKAYKCELKESGKPSTYNTNENIPEQIDDDGLGLPF